MARRDLRRPLRELLFEPVTAASFFWLGGIVAALLMTVVAPWPRRHLVVALCSIAAALVVAVTRFLMGRRVPVWTLHVDLVFATALVSVVLAEAPVGFNVCAIFYVWVSLYVAIYFSRRSAAAHIAAVAAAYAAVLLWGPTVHEPVIAWIMVVGTSVTFAAIVATLVNALRETSAEDPLTHLANRRSWEERVSDEMQRAQRTATPLSIASLDINGFKHVNDGLGHQAGDRLLCRFVDGWSETVRGGGDFLARLGGDEFGLLSPGSGELEIRRVVERLRQVSPDGVTCSIGFATWDGTESADDLFRRADQAMFREKQRGTPA